MASSSTSEAGGLRFFSGDTEDGREYKRWKQWVKNKLLTLDKLPESSRGAYIYTLLSGKALESVEHLDPEVYQKKGGDDALWTILDRRFPQQEQVDELGEILTEVFNLRSLEGENMKQWTARGSELFDRCQRKTGVSFPDEARGWLLLHRSGLTEEQKAVTIARARGDLKRESIAAALRSCYPDMVISRKRTGIALAEDSNPPDEPADAEGLEEGFSDVELLLDDHHLGADPVQEGESFAEADVAEVLAATWREKRQELNRLQKTRQFQKAKDVKRSFRVEIEEMKPNSTCNRCGRRGHWARECRSKDTAKGSGKGRPTPPPTGASGAAMVNELDFVASVSDRPSLLDRVRAHCARVDRGVDPTPDCAPEDEILLVSSPGYGVIDSGCGRTIVGASTLKAFERLWTELGWDVPQPFSEVHQFKFGNGEVETSRASIQLPVILANRKGLIRAAIIRGDAPLLLSRTALKSLGASLDFEKDCLHVFGKAIKLKTNSAGQYIVNLMGEKTESPPVVAFTEVMATCEEPSCRDESSCGESAAASIPPEPVADPMASDANADPPDTAMWSQENSDVCASPWLSQGGPRWKSVFRRRVVDSWSKKVLDDSSFVPGTPQHKTIVRLPNRVDHVHTEFFYVLHAESSPKPDSWVPTAHQARRLKREAETCLAVHESRSRSTCLVMEIFSPPRFSPVAEQAGFRAHSYDLTTGQDFRRLADRKQVEDDLMMKRPELLILCPPCTHEGGWFHLNQTKLSAVDCLRIRTQSRSYIRWCCKLFRMQVDLGGRAVFEHPTGSRVWSYSEMQALRRRHTTVKLHMSTFQ